jgi:hypothetical protein
MILLKRLDRAKKIQPMRIDATQITAAQGDPVAIEEFEDLDRNLAPVLHLVAKLRGRELPVRRLPAKDLNDADHLGDGIAQEEMVVGDFVELAEATEKLAEMTDFVLCGADQAGDVANAWRTEALLAPQERPDRLPQMLLVPIEAHLMPREPHP